jgi:head-tail adaptor
MAKTPGVADLKHRITLCSQRDVVSGGTLELNRVKVFDTWAMIRPVTSSAFSRDGFTVKDAQDQQTHEIVMRYRVNYDITVAAWVYEERRKSPPRWFRVIRVVNMDEASQFISLKCKLYESNDDAPTPETPATDSGIKVETALPRGFTA